MPLKQYLSGLEIKAKMSVKFLSKAQILLDSLQDIHK